MPTVEPGYMKPLLPSEAPKSPEEWKDIMADIEQVIMPGVSNSILNILNYHQQFIWIIINVPRNNINNSCKTKSLMSVLSSVFVIIL